MSRLTGTLAVVAVAIAAIRDLIAEDVHIDTRKLYTNEGFDSGLDSLKKVADERRAYLLKAIPVTR